MTEPGLPYTDEQLSSKGPDINNGDSSALRDLCSKLHNQVTAFLQEDVKTERLKAVQAQVRQSLAIIQEALDKYEYTPFFPGNMKPIAHGST